MHRFVKPYNKRVDDQCNKDRDEKYAKESHTEASLIVSELEKAGRQSGPISTSKTTILNNKFDELPEAADPALSRMNQHTVPVKTDCRTPFKGKWLIEAGFPINANITIRIMNGCLVITNEETSQ